MPRAQARHRSKRGNMLFLCVALLVLFIALMALVFGVYFLADDQKKLQGHCENLALEAAQTLNYHNCSGRLNNLQRGARESVFEARQMADECQEERLSELAPLAYQVLDEARESAHLVEVTRVKFVGFSDNKLHDLLRANPQITDLQVGSLTPPKQGKAVLLSSVEASPGNAALNQYDESQGYIQKGKILDLYKSAVNLKLPGPDNDLSFVLSTLPAAVKGTVAPMRLSTAGFSASSSLRQAGVDSIESLKASASSVRLKMTTKSKPSLLPTAYNNEITTGTVSTACANGAEPEPGN